MAIKIGGSKIINDSYEWDGHNLVPNTDNTYDLGSSAREWKDLYVDGTGHIDVVRSQNIESSYGYKLWHDTAGMSYIIDTLGRWSGRDLLPDQDNTYDLGSSAKEWKDLYVDGIGYIDTLSPVAMTGNLFNMSQSGSETGVGLNALNSSSTGYNNSAFGVNALEYITSGYMNTAAGANALRNNTTGLCNSAFGASSLKNNTTGGNNTALGFGAQMATTSGSSNTAVGDGAMTLNTSGSDNAALGKDALRLNTEGCYNVASGVDALFANSTGNGNTGIGHDALTTTTSGDSNVGVGREAGKLISSGGTNTCIGAYSGFSATTGSNNLLLGSSAGTAYSPSGLITTGSNIVCLGNNAITDLYCKDSSISTSDERDKNDIKDFSLGLDFVNKLRPVTYKWDMRSDYLTSQSGLTAGPQTIEDITNDGTYMKPKIETGFIAQEVLSLLEEEGYATNKDDMLMVNLNEDETSYGIKYERIIPILVNAIQDLSLRLEGDKND